MEQTRQKTLILILARELATNMATPVFVVDAEGKLVFYNEAAEGILGEPFDEVGELTRDQWSEAFSPEWPDVPPTLASRSRGEMGSAGTSPSPPSPWSWAGPCSRGPSRSSGKRAMTRTPRRPRLPKPGPTGTEACASGCGGVAAHWRRRAPRRSGTGEIPPAS